MRGWVAVQVKAAFESERECPHLIRRAPRPCHWDFHQQLIDVEPLKLGPELLMRLDGEAVESAHTERKQVLDYIRKLGGLRLRCQVERSAPDSVQFGGRRRVRGALGRVDRFGGANHAI